MADKPVILITGTRKGIGRYLVQYYAQNGYSVLGCSRSPCDYNGNDVLIARGTIIQAHASWIKIGERCIIGAQCQLASQGGISLGNSVGIAGQCYIGGGRYPLDDRNIPIKDQLPYSKGPVIIEDEVAIGAGVIVQDGVRIGKGSMIGAGAIVREDLPEYTVVTPYQRFILFPRGQAEGNPLRS